MSGSFGILSGQIPLYYGGMILIPELGHGHLQGADIQEIFIFANNATSAR